MPLVKAKKHLGQHFINNDQLAKDITELLSFNKDFQILEIGPGMGVLTKFLMNVNINFKVIEIDKESITYLKNKYPDFKENIIEGDFLKFDLKKNFKSNISIIGNFPYYISSQILFRVWDHNEKIQELVGMFQKEVADRIIALKGRERGILSVLIQVFYNVENCIDVSPENFTPPPKIQSSVIKLNRNNRKELECSKKLFKQVVKTAFNQRRKTLRNALKTYNIKKDSKVESLLSLRAEQLNVEDFIKITKHVEAIL
ncbi:MAG: 16S rRNA (adenine(1518)-N(6)/adenine(1519)-N(6))-dimethyltransferase RsmA [Flavobacteriales bacterium]|jgi:16S rRNA (adenine1518-N6/adenine1519-N6)-dimethyltransferase|tara:strand:+ start:4987 stop:5757 length:771 start_codon:yes stop_codon:yes gene_type:complete